jgi:hypothetical protein
MSLNNRVAGKNIKRTSIVEIKRPSLKGTKDLDECFICSEVGLALDQTVLRENK